MFSALLEKLLRGTRTRSPMIYFDHAAATPLDPDVFRAMKPYFSVHYGNAGSIHREGEIAKQALLATRKTCAEALRVQSGEIIFTGNGTEANNLAVFGVIQALERGGRKISTIHAITTTIEHPSILECFRKLERDGVKVTYLPVTNDGRVEPETLKAALTDNTALVSVMYVNNEVGTIEPIRDLGRIIQSFRKNKQKNTELPYFHTDASQAPLYLDVSPDALGVDLLTLDGQKIYGPKGVGLLYKKKGVPCAPVIVGGGQESGLRPGTENIPLIVGLGEALARAVSRREKDTIRVTSIRDYCLSRLTKAFPDALIHGPHGGSLQNRIANNVHVSFPNIDTEFLVVALSEKGIACGTKSACIREENAPSYVLAAMGKVTDGGSGLRLSFGRYTRVADIDRFIHVLLSIMKNFDNSNKE